MNIFLFESLEANQTTIVEKGIRLQSDYPIATELPSGEGIITGTADYALGYREGPDIINPSYRNSVVIIQEKQSLEEHRGPTQALAFMLGLQQKRLQFDPDCAALRHFAIISDGIHWQFLRLEGKKLVMSASFDITCSA